MPLEPPRKAVQRFFGLRLSLVIKIASAICSLFVLEQNNNAICGARF